MASQWKSNGQLIFASSVQKAHDNWGIALIVIPSIYECKPYEKYGDKAESFCDNHRCFPGKYYKVCHCLYSFVWKQNVCQSTFKFILCDSLPSSRATIAIVRTSRIWLIRHFIGTLLLSLIWNVVMVRIGRNKIAEQS